MNLSETENQSRNLRTLTISSSLNSRSCVTTAIQVAVGEETAEEEVEVVKDLDQEGQLRSQLRKSSQNEQGKVNVVTTQTVITRQSSVTGLKET